MREIKKIQPNGKYGHRSPEVFVSVTKRAYVAGPVKIENMHEGAVASLSNLFNPAENGLEFQLYGDSE